MGYQSPSIMIRMFMQCVGHCGSVQGQKDIDLHRMVTNVGKFEHKDGEKEICIGKKPSAKACNPRRVRKE